MKHIVMVVALALPVLVLADEAKPAQPQPRTEDSPMVAAAKRANRKGRKPANVITNATLAKSGGNAHITTTAHQAPIVLPKAPVAASAEVKAIQARDKEKRRAAASAEAVKKAGESREQADAAAAAAAEDGMYEDREHDPAQAEKAQEDASRKPPQR
ncbi:MAG TPA: hypothetical protein VND45_02945 [Thermoanaerobaculia bacterium]|jgi:hypothetical protein|nr:hypothetical protein [Thermoanaerobaculia bacterium]